MQNEARNLKYAPTHAHTHTRAPTPTHPHTHTPTPTPTHPHSGSPITEAYNDANCDEQNKHCEYYHSRDDKWWQALCCLTCLCVCMCVCEGRGGGEGEETGREGKRESTTLNVHLLEKANKQQINNNKHHTNNNDKHHINNNTVIKYQW